MDKLSTLESIARKFGLKDININRHSIPNFIYDIPLARNEKYILNYLCRRSNKVGACFVSQIRICKDCGFKSPKTVRLAIKKLKEIGLVRILEEENLAKDKARAKRVNTYKVCGGILETVLSNNSDSYKSRQNLPPTRVKNAHIDRENLPSKEVVKEKENKIKEGIENISDEDLVRIVDEHMKTLTPEERRLLERRAESKIEFSCPSPDRKSIEMYKLRYICIVEDK